MTVNLLSVLHNEFSEDAIERIAGLLGEVPDGIRSALNQSVVAIVAALAHKTQAPSGAAEVFGTLRHRRFDGTALGALGSVLKAGASGSDLLKMGTPLDAALFGAQSARITGRIASATGIRPNAAASLFRVVLPFVLNVIGREARLAGGFNVTSVARLLGDQREPLRGVIHPDVATAVASIGFDHVAAGFEPVHATTAPRNAWKWLAWTAPLVLLPLAFWSLPNLTRTEPRDDVVGTAGTPDLVAQRLSCGEKLVIAPGGVEAQLVAFIDDGTRSVDTKTWLTFDRLEFKSGSAHLSPGSQTQARNIAAILRCYPNVTLKIVGVVDTAGDAASNQRLAHARAESVKQAIVVQGINLARLEVEESGEPHTSARRTTDDARQRHRGVAVRVTGK